MKIYNLSTTYPAPKFGMVDTDMHWYKNQIEKLALSSARGKANTIIRKAMELDCKFIYIGVFNNTVVESIVRKHLPHIEIVY